MFSWLANLMAGKRAGSRRSSSKAVPPLARHIYTHIVEQARQPVFYSQLGVTDNIPGRFELLTLHMFLVLDRLNDSSEIEIEVAQELVDVMFDDMDSVARETGIGDMGVGPRIKKLSRSFRSRLELYKRSLEDEDEVPLSEHLLEVFFKAREGQKEQAAQLAEYVEQGREKLQDMSWAQISKAEGLFAEPVFEPGQNESKGGKKAEKSDS